METHLDTQNQQISIQMVSQDQPAISVPLLDSAPNLLVKKKWTA